MKWLWHWAVSALALLVVAWLFRGITVDHLYSAFLAALVLGLVNAILRPVLQILALPITIATFGLFALVINAVLLLFTSHIVPGFHVHGFFTALFGSIVLSIVSSIMHRLLEDEARR